MPECSHSHLQVPPATVGPNHHGRVLTPHDDPFFPSQHSRQGSPCDPTPQPQLTGQASTVYCPLGIWGGGSGMSNMWWRGWWPGLLWPPRPGPSPQGLGRPSSWRGQSPRGSKTLSPTCTVKVIIESGLVFMTTRITEKSSTSKAPWPRGHRGPPAPSGGLEVSSLVPGTTLLSQSTVGPWQLVQGRGGKTFSFCSLCHLLPWADLVHRCTWARCKCRTRLPGQQPKPVSTL